MRKLLLLAFLCCILTGVIVYDVYAVGTVVDVTHNVKVWYTANANTGAMAVSFAPEDPCLIKEIDLNAADAGEGEGEPEGSCTATFNSAQGTAYDHVFTEEVMNLTGIAEIPPWPHTMSSPTAFVHMLRQPVLVQVGDSIDFAWSNIGEDNWNIRIVYEVLRNK